MSGNGMFFGALIGLLITRSAWGAVVGALIGYLLYESLGLRAASGGGTAGQAASISDAFFRTTFELMGHVAKSDGRVTEAEIDAARRLMQDFKLGPREVSLAIDFFRNGKSAAYDPGLGVARFREACGQRHDLMRAFMELQMRAALDGNGLSPSARAILTRTAAILGMSGAEFAYVEASLRARAAHARNGARGSQAGARSTSGAPPLAECYAELEVEAAVSDQEVTKAYRRQMSRHHPDKLVANGLPESMTQVAKEKTQRIQEAYEAIRAARGMR